MLIHKDHVSAVMDVAFSPTGREFVSGSYDRTVRIFSTTGGRSRDVYHTKRMQRIFCVNYSADARFVLSGSDDTNVRIWKAEASDTLGTWVLWIVSLILVHCRKQHLLHSSLYASYNTH